MDILERSLSISRMDKPSEEWMGAEDERLHHEEVVNEIQSLRTQLAELQKVVDIQKKALEDMLSGWRYIRQSHGDLYGVGWDRAQDKAEAALAADNKGDTDENKRM